MQRFDALTLAFAAFASLPAQAASPQQQPLEAALAEWRTDHGDSWRLSIDSGTGYAEFVYGGAARIFGAPVSEAQWFSAAREALAATRDLHGLEGSTLVEHWTQFLPLGMVGTTDKLTVRFRQEVAGVPVEGGWANVLFDARGALLSVQTRALPALGGFDTTPALSADAGVEAALALFRGEHRFEGALVHEPRLVIAQIEQAESRSGVLCWRVEVLGAAVEGDERGGIYFIDAKSGVLAAREELIHHFDISGNVKSFATPGTSADTASNPETAQNLAYTRVTAGAVTATTDVNGNFNLAGVNAPANVTFAYTGTFNNISNQAGSPYSLVVNLTQASGNNVVLNQPANDLVTAQANINIAVNRDRDWVRATNPTDSKADFVHTANANIAATCNATFNGSAINFYQAGGGCVNTAFSTVISHEDGHWLNQIYGTGNGNDGMGEGNADVWGMYVWDTAVVGSGFSGGGSQIRSGLNTRQFCGDASPGCYNGVHANGEPWMGAAWKVRRNLKNTLGATPGGLTANALFLGWMNSYNQTQIRSVIETQWLTLDDNDGNINNGTPRFNAIDSGFREQGFPGVAISPIAFSNVTALASTADEIGPYVVSATVQSTTGGSVLSATLRYRVGSAGPYLAVPMSTSGGGVYSAAIPGQASPAIVSYYLEAVDSTAITGLYPAGAPATNVPVFAVGELETVFSDNFNTSLGWSVTNAALTSGAWERGDPIGTTSNSEQVQPELAFGGSGSCFFTDQGAVGGQAATADVDGGPTQLVSPLIDASGTRVLVSYAAWLFNDDGDDSLTVAVSNDGGVNWVTARTFTGLRGGWFQDAFDLASFVAPSATVRLRFSTADNPNNSLTEAAIDSVSVIKVESSNCTSFTNYCTAKINSQLCFPRILPGGGTPSASNGLPFQITGFELISNKTAVLFYGFAPAAAPFQFGTLCVQTPVKRTPQVNTGGSLTGNDCTGAPIVDFNSIIQGGGDPLLVPGATVYTQWYYRDPAVQGGVGLTDGLNFQICP
jgi:hypothetical protein